jgi:hypothetical protein
LRFVARIGSAATYGAFKRNQSYHWHQLAWYKYIIEAQLSLERGDSSMTISSEREAHLRLSICLARLAAFKPADLARTDRRKSIFRNGLPHFERTLSLFRQVAHSNLRGVPPEYLNVVADDAEKTLARFREILSFTGEDVEDPKEVSAAMISAVRDAYEPIYEKLSPIIKAPVSEPEVVRKPKRRFALAIGVAIAVLAAAIVGSHFAGYHYAQYTVFAEKMASALR